MAYILVADDDPSIRLLLAVSLVAEGFEVVTAANGQDATGIIRENPPTLVLLDLESSPLANWEVYGWIHRSCLANVPVVVLTLDERRDLAHQKRRGTRANAEPFDVTTVLKRITRVLGSSPKQRQRESLVWAK